MKTAAYSMASQDPTITSSRLQDKLSEYDYNMGLGMIYGQWFKWQSAWTFALGPLGPSPSAGLTAYKEGKLGLLLSIPLDRPRQQEFMAH